MVRKVVKDYSRRIFNNGGVGLSAQVIKMGKDP